MILIGGLQPCDTSHDRIMMVIVVVRFLKPGEWASQKNGIAVGSKRLLSFAFA